MKNSRIRASDDEIAVSLQGNWRAEHLFALKQALDAFDFCGRQLAECDAQIEAQLERLRKTEADPAKGKRRGTARNAPNSDLRGRLFQMCGVDLTPINGVDLATPLVVVSEIGADLSRFPSDKHFASWLGLCPVTKTTGGKLMSGQDQAVRQRRGEGAAAAIGDELHPAAQQYKLLADIAGGFAVVVAEVGDGLEVGGQSHNQPDQLEVALRLSLRAPAGLHPVGLVACG